MPHRSWHVCEYTRSSCAGVQVALILTFLLSTTQETHTHVRDSGIQVVGSSSLSGTSVGPAVALSWRDGPDGVGLAPPKFRLSMFPAVLGSKLPVHIAVWGRSGRRLLAAPTCKCRHPYNPCWCQGASLRTHSEISPRWRRVLPPWLSREGVGNPWRLCQVARPFGYSLPSGWCSQVLLQ